MAHIFFRQILIVPELDDEASIVNRTPEKFASCTVQKRTEVVVQPSSCSTEQGNKLSEFLFVIVCA